MKRLISACLLTCVLLVLNSTTKAELSFSQEETVDAALLIEVATGTRLWEKEADAAFSVAGLAKLPAILTLAQSMDSGGIQADTLVRVSARAAEVTGPTAFLEDGEQIAASELMKAAVMISAGDAITALAETAYGADSVFCGNINATLKQSGLDKTLVNAMGEGVMLSCAELALLGRDAALSKTFMRYCSLYYDTVLHSGGRETELVNANRLINNYPGCTGLLTGSSQADGYCGMFLAGRGDTALLAVIVGAQSAAVRAAAAVELLDYGFANFRLETLAQEAEAFVSDLPVRSGDIKSVHLVTHERIDELVDARSGTIQKRVNAPEYLEAPFDTETVLGSVDFIDSSGKEILSVPLFASEAAAAFGVKDIILRIMLVYIGFSP